MVASYSNRGKIKEDLSGQVINGVTVLKFNGWHSTPNHTRHSLWECRCHCGTVFTTRANGLKSGNTKSCGCIRRTNARNLSVSNRHNPKEHALLSWFDAYQGGARARGIVFELTLGEFRQLAKQLCHYCGSVPEPRDRAKRIYERSVARKPGHTVDAQFAEAKIEYLSGLDRVDSSKNYTINNVVACCSACNRGKGSLTYEQWQAHLRQIYEYVKKQVDAADVNK